MKKLVSLFSKPFLAFALLLLASYAVYGQIQNYVDKAVRQAVRAAAELHAAKTAKIKQNHAKELAKTKARMRAKMRLQATASIFPGAAVVVKAYVEKQEFDSWKEDHPNGTLSEYTEEVSVMMNVLLKEEYADFRQRTKGVLRDTWFDNATE